MDPDQEMMLASDTNQEALSCKISAVRKGYFKDSFAQQFGKFKGRRDIIMHRGYWARVQVVRKLVVAALTNEPSMQIVSLGCGLDTLFFNLADQGILKGQHLFVQLDLPVVVQKKVKKLNRSAKVKGLFTRLGQEPVATDYSFSTPHYQLQSCDLSNLLNFKEALTNAKIDVNRPIFFYCECVLSYVEAKAIDQLLQWIRQSFKVAILFDYQMFNPTDRFGQMMVKNFEARGCPLIGVNDYPLLEDQRKRFEKAGFKLVNVHTMADIYYKFINKQDRTAIEILEMLDEFQEWNIIMSHYFGLLAYSAQQTHLQQLNKLAVDVSFDKL